MLLRLLQTGRVASSLRSDEVVRVGEHPVRLRVNPRARRVSLRLDPVRREAVATAPSARRLPEALAFAQSRHDWIEAGLSRLPRAFPFRPGAVIEVGGEPCRLDRAAMRIRARWRPASSDEPSRLLASGDGAVFARAVERALRTEALSRLTARTAVHSQSLAQPPPNVGVHDARSRWGSCRPARGDRLGSIRYNWRLVLAPADVLDYVVAHECAHLVEANHGPRFWALVQRLYGDPACARAWLRAHGARLHAIGRADP